MAENRQIREFDEIIHGTTASSNVKMTDHILLQHEDVSGNVNTFNRFTVGQTMCQPVAVTPNSTPSNGAYTATCNNFPDFAVSYTDKNGNSHFLIGMKVRVVFTTGITYGSTSANPVTYPTLNINGTGAYPLLAQGMTMGAGAASERQTLELTLIPYGSNSVAWDADTNVREHGDNYTVYTNAEPTNALKFSGDKQYDSFDIDSLPIDGIRAYIERSNTAVAWIGGDGFILNLPWTSNSYGCQLAMDDQSNYIAIRTKSNGQWRDWQEIQRKVVETETQDSVSGEKLEYFKFGKLVIVNVLFTGDGTSTRKVMSYTIPSDFVPAGDFRAVLIRNDIDKPIGQVVAYEGENSFVCFSESALPAKQIKATLVYMCN